MSLNFDIQPFNVPIRGLFDVPNDEVYDMRNISLCSTTDNSTNVYDTTYVFQYCPVDGVDPVNINGNPIKINVRLMDPDGSYYEDSLHRCKNGHNSTCLGTHIPGELFGRDTNAVFSLSRAPARKGAWMCPLCCGGESYSDCCKILPYIKGTMTMDKFLTAEETYKYYQRLTILKTVSKHDVFLIVYDNLVALKNN